MFFCLSLPGSPQKLVRAHQKGREGREKRAAAQDVRGQQWSGGFGSQEAESPWLPRAAPGAEGPALLPGQTLSVPGYPHSPPPASLSASIDPSSLYCSGLAPRKNNQG